MSERKIFVMDGGNGEEGVINSIFQMMKQILVTSGFPDDGITEGIAYSKALEHWSEMKAAMIEKGISSDINNIICSSKKSEAQKYCHLVEITHEDFSNFVVLSKEEGFKHELHTAEFLPDGIVESQLPSVLQYEKGKDLYVEGDTDLTNKQLISVIKNRKRMHVHFFEKDSEWHCFYFTFSDLKGEHWTSQHLHYVSHLWTGTKEEVLANLTDTRRHKQVGDHVTYIPPIIPTKGIVIPVMK